MADLRQRILEAFGVSEEDMLELQALEDASGYTAAKAAADADRAAFVADLERGIDVDRILLREIVG